MTAASAGRCSTRLRDFRISRILQLVALRVRLAELLFGPSESREPGRAVLRTSQELHCGSARPTPS